MPDHICARCARNQKTCCQEREIYVTPGDVRRIEAHTGHGDFFEFRMPADPTYLDQDDDPTWRDRVFRDDGSRRSLKRRDDGDCTFLGPVGCTLPSDVRPLVCRLYPFDYTEAGIQQDLAEGCPLHLLLPGETILTALDMRLADAERLRAQLYDELSEEPLRGRELTHAAWPNEQESERQCMSSSSKPES